jgi:hypothetical protein
LELTEAWKNSPSRDAEGREKLFLSLKLLGKLRINLESLILDGRMAQKALDERTVLQKASDKMRDWAGF